MRAIIAAGPVSGLIVGAVVSHVTGPREAFLVLSVTACDGGGKSSNHPDAPEADAYFSNCGHPGDVGNEMGVNT